VIPQHSAHLMCYLACVYCPVIYLISDAACIYLSKFVALCEPPDACNGDRNYSRCWNCSISMFVNLVGCFTNRMLYSTEWANKNVPLYFCPYLRQLLIDFQNSFTDTLRTIYNNVIIIHPVTP